MSEPAQSKVRDLRSFPALVRTRRAVTGWTQADLAHRARVAITTVGRWERGETMPNLSMVAILADVLDVSEEAVEAAIRPESDGDADVVDLVPRGAGADDGLAPSELERFKALVFDGLEHDKGSDELWSTNVRNLASVLGIPWEGPSGAPPE